MNEEKRIEVNSSGEDGTGKFPASLIRCEICNSSWGLAEGALCCESCEYKYPQAVASLRNAYKQVQELDAKAAVLAEALAKVAFCWNGAQGCWGDGRSDCITNPDLGHDECASANFALSNGAGAAFLKRFQAAKAVCALHVPCCMYDSDIEDCNRCSVYYSWRDME